LQSSVIEIELCNCILTIAIESSLIGILSVKNAIAELFNCILTNKWNRELSSWITELCNWVVTSN